MTIAEASLLIFLLFPPKNAWQKEIYEALNKAPFVSQENLLKKAQLEKYLDELSLMLVDNNAALELIENDEEDFLAEEIDEERKESIAEFFYRNSSNKIKVFEYGEEKLSIEKKNNGDLYSISLNKNTFSRIKYDSDYHPVEQVVWKNGENLENSPILQKNTWTYDEDSVTVFEDNIQQKTAQSIVYDKNKRPVKIVDFKDEEIKQKNLDAKNSDNSEKQETEYVRYQSKITLFEYDEEGRLLSEENRVYKFAGKDKPEQLKFKKKKVYKYTSKNESPDFELYEDDVLRCTQVYIDEHNWEERFFFTEKMVMVNKFTDGEKISDEIINVDKLVNYE